MSEPVPVVVYGATGYTGRLVCAELVRQNVAFVAAGRDANKLAALPGPIETVVAALDDAPALERMAARGRVVLDCAGPFVKYGRPVQDAALATGRHFLDVSGEAGYMRDTAARDAEARARKVALINAVGFDVVPTDAAAVLACETAGAPIARLRIAFGTRSRPTQGTMRSALGGAGAGGLAYVNGAYRREPIGAERWELELPELGRRTCISVPWGDLATAPRSTGAREVRTFLALRATAARFGVALRPFVKLAGRPLFKRIAERVVRALPEGPSDDERQRSRFGVYAEAEGKQGRGAAWVSGGDGYDFTAVSAVWCALRAAAPDFAVTGTPTPTQAFGARALLEGMGPIIRWGEFGVA
jgi:saccharopine dehydrogenase (NAD+, L-lysine-forming)